MLEVIRGLGTKTKVFVSCCFPSVLNHIVWGLNFDVGGEEQMFGVSCIAKAFFSQTLELSYRLCSFLMFSVALELIFIRCDPLETGLKFSDFKGLLWPNPISSKITKKCTGLSHLCQTGISLWPSDPLLVGWAWFAFPALRQVMAARPINGHLNYHLLPLSGLLIVILGY